MDTNKPLNATDEVAAAEAELKAAQERLDAAKAKLAAVEASVSEADAPENALVDAEAGNAGARGLSEAEDTCDAEPSVAAEAAEAFEVVEIVEVVEAVEGAGACDGAEAHEASDADASDGNVPDADTSGIGVADAAPDRADKPASESGANRAPDWIPSATPQTPTSSPVYGDAQQPGYDPATRSMPQQPPATPFGAASGSPYQPPVGYVAPGYGQPPHVGPNAVPPQQAPYGYQQPYRQEQYAPPVVGTKDHVAAGLLAIFLGWLGIHKFYLGYNTAGFIMLAVSIVGGIFTVTLATWVIWVIAIIEGILYLTKSQTEFEHMYVLNKKEWF